MIPYFLAFSVALIFSCIPRNNAQLHSISLLFLMVIIGIFAGVFIGKDFTSYEQIFYSVPNFSTLMSDRKIFNEIYGESGYIALQSLMKFFISDYIYFNLIFVFASVSIKIFFLSKYSYLFTIAAVWYVSMFLYLDMTATRHGFAAALLLLSIPFFASKQYLTFVVVVLLAGAFHSVAYIGLLLPLAHHIVQRKALFLVTIMASVWLGFIGFGNILTTFFVNADIGNYAAERVINYAETKYNSEAGLLRGVVLKQGVFLLFTYFILRKKIKTRLYDAAMGMYLLSFVFLVSLNDFSLLANRISNMLGVVECLIISSVPLAFSKKDRNYVVVVIIALSFLQLTWLARSFYIDYRVFI